jgi:hydrogenase maturation protein HypF
MAENDYMKPVIGVSFDGTGYGTDGTIWGGEFLLADDCSFTRYGHITPFLQIGGDSSAKEGWRIAVSMIYGLMKNEEQALEAVKSLKLCSEQEAKIMFRMYDRKMNAVVSTSAGRLFDAVSAILGIRRRSTFEGEASTALQFAAEAYVAEHPSMSEETTFNQGAFGQKAFNQTAFNQTASGQVIFGEASSNQTVSGQATFDQAAAGETVSSQATFKHKPSYDRESSQQVVLSTDALVAMLIEQKIRGENPGKLAYDFHRALANLIIHTCMEMRAQTKRNVIALSGGCFQNLLLLDFCKKGLERRGFSVLIHHLVPPNDGGIALGQAVVAGNLFSAAEKGSPT